MVCPQFSFGEKDGLFPSAYRSWEAAALLLWSSLSRFSGRDYRAPVPWAFGPQAPFSEVSGMLNYTFSKLDRNSFILGIGHKFTHRDRS